MSFSTHFVARSKSHAKVLLAAQSLPSCVSKFIETAIDDLPTAEERMIQVKAVGHLCNGGYSGVSSATIEVTPISVSS